MTTDFIGNFNKEYSDSKFEEFKKRARDIANKIDYDFNHQEIFWNALSIRGSKLSTREFERLEFIGDSLLGAIIGLILFEEKAEGDPEILTNYRKEITKNSTLANFARNLGLDEIGKLLEIGNLSENQAADTFEAIIGAIFIDTEKNFDKTKEIIGKILNIEDIAKKIEKTPWGARDPKSVLNEYIQKKYKGKAELDFSSENIGSQQNPKWVSTASIKIKNSGDILFEAKGEPNSKKKEAEKNASEKLLKLLIEKGEYEN